MYVPSQERLALNVPKGKDVCYINKARVDDEAVENDAPGLTTLGDDILTTSGLKKRTMYLINRGQTAMFEVAEGLIEGTIKAFQYHGENYESPQWKIHFGFLTDVDKKNAEYAANKGGKKKSQPKTKKTKRSLIY